MTRLPYALPAIVVAFFLAISPAKATLIDSLDTSFTIIDFGAPSSFSFGVSKATAGITGLFNSVLTFSGSFTDGGTDGGSLSPFGGAFIAQVLLDGTPAAPSVGSTINFTMPTESFGPFQTSAILNAADFGGTINTLSLLVTFTGSGGGDAINISASLQLFSIPEPASLTLLLLGIVWMGVLQRRKDCGEKAGLRLKA